MVRGRKWIVVLAFVSACGTATATEQSPTSAPATTPTSTSTSTSTTVATSTSEFLSSTSTTTPFQPTVFCFREPPPPYGPDEAPYTFDPDFYVHYCSASGVFVVGSANVPIEALEAGARIVDRMFGHDPQLISTIVSSRHAVILTGPDETAGDLPEWRFEEGRTFAPDPDHPGFVSTGGGLTYAVAPADDVMCDVPPAKHGSYGTPEWGIVLVHELGHLLESAVGLTGLEALFEIGTASGAWDPRLYAMTNPREYWAEVVQVYAGQFELKRRGLRQPTTRHELREEDQAAFDLVSSLLGGSSLVQYWCSIYDGPVTPLPLVPDAPVTD